MSHSVTPGSSGVHWRDEWFVAAAWLVSGLILFFNLGAAPLTDLDEGAFSEATREMLLRDDFISPWLLDAPRFDKPALIHWLQISAFSVTGLTSFGARLPSAIMGLVWVGVIAGLAYAIAGRLAPRARLQVYGWAVLMAGSCIGIPAMSRAATADATLNAFLVLTLFFTWRALWPAHQTESGRLWIRLAAACVALGLLTKGPIALLVPAAASLIAVTLCGRALMARWMRLCLDPAAWGIVVLIAAPWYVLQFQAQGMPFIEGFLGLHNLGRFTSTMHGFSAGPLYYPTWMLIATLPWTTVVVATLLLALQDGAAGKLLRSPELRMCWATFLFVLVFFSFSATKLPHYGFYGLSGLVVLMSLLTAVHPPRWSTLMLSLLALLGLIGFLLHPLGLTKLTQQIQDPYHQMVLSEALVQFQAKRTLLTGLALTGLLSCLIGVRHLRLGLLGACLALGVTVYGVAVPTVMQALRNPIVEIAQVIKERASRASNDAPKRVITWRLTAPSLSFAAQEVIPASTPAEGDWVVMPSHLMSELPRGDGEAHSVLFEKTGISLVQIQPRIRP